MTGEKFQDKDRLSARVGDRIRQSVFLVGGAIAVAATVAPVSAFVRQYLNTGSVDCYFPSQIKDRAIPHGLSGMTWNTAGKTLGRSREILEFMDSGGNLAMLQEVPRQDYEAYARIMHYRNRPYSVCFVQADAKPKLLQGGLGNMIISDQIPEDTMSYRMKGRSLPGLAKKITVSLFNDAKNVVSVRLSPSTVSVGLDLSFSNLRKADEEDRAILGFTLKMRDEDGRVVRVKGLTGHLSGHQPFRGRQLQRLGKVIDLNKRGSLPLLIGFDANTDPEEMVPLLESYGLYTRLTEPTSSDGRVIDYIGYSPSSRLGIVAIQRGTLRSDHYNVQFRFQTHFFEISRSLRPVW